MVFLSEKQANELQKEIEANYGSVPNFGKSNDVRQNVYNYDHPFAERVINCINYKIVEGLIERNPCGNNEKTWLLYANGRIVGKSYNVNDIKTVINQFNN
jgi:hypothetical protein